MILERLKSDPEQAKAIEKDTNRTVLHRVVEYIASRYYSNYDPLFVSLIAAYPEALTQKDVYDKYPSDYTKYVAYTTCYGAVSHYDCATGLLDLLNNGRYKEKSYSHPSQPTASEYRSTSYVGGFFGSDDMFINQKMIEAYQNALIQRDTITESKELPGSRLGGTQ